MSITLTGGCQEKRPTSPIIINEISTNNHGATRDDVGNIPDWVEFYNQTDDTLNLESYYLTDDPEVPNMYSFADDDSYLTEILPKSHLLIWCGTDSNSLDARAEFKLTSKKGGLYLYGIDGYTLMDKVEYEKQYADVSYGRKGDASGKWTYFYPPSPGQTNATEERKGKSGKVEFSKVGGLYEKPFKVSLKGKSKNIYYSLDGRVPDGNEVGEKYSGPIAIDSGMVIRARIIEEGKIPGKVQTHTYLLNEKSRLPIICFTTHPRNLFSKTRGLMRDRNSLEPWEHPANVEYYLPDGSLAFNQGFAARLFGFYGKNAIKKSFVFRCRNKFGPKKIKYKLFGSKDIEEFDGIVVRADATYAIRRTEAGRMYAGERVKNELIYHLIKQMESPLADELQAYQPVLMFVNGRYFGVYTMMERKASGFLKSNFGVKDAEIINPFFNDVNRGSLRDWYDLMDYIDDNDLQDPEVWKYIESRIDITEFVDHFILEAWTSKGDGNRNTRIWRENTPGSQWHTIPYDWDHWKGPKRDNIRRMYKSGRSGKSAIFKPFMKNKDFYNFFANRYNDWLNTVLTYKNVSEVVDRVYLESADEQARDREFWTSRGQTYTEVQDQRDWIKDFALEKGFWIRDQFRDVLKTGEARKVTLNTSTGAGSIKISTIEIDEFPWTGVYFDGIPFQLTAVPPAGFRFTGWSDKSLPQEASVTIILSSNAEFIASFEPIE